MSTVIGKQLIPAFSINQTPDNLGNNILVVSEFFTNTIQGEGIYTGQPATFLRLTGCTLNCQWCDTSEVWRFGSAYSFEQLFKLMEENNVISLLKDGQHLVLTGGSPLKQQLDLISFLQEFKKKYRFSPFVEIENECTLTVHPVLVEYIQCWNNSPKLSNSGNSRMARHKPHIISQLGRFNNSWFKFVVDSEEDWQEIQMDFLDTELIQKKQIILMPKGATKAELEENQGIVVQMVVQHNVRYCSREHIVLWDKKTGV